jgi:uncharacterized protein with von Willebrand factor type A (vWA) domain
MIQQAISAVLCTPPVFATIVSTDANGNEKTLKRFTSVTVSVTEKGYVVAGIDAEDDTILCTGSTDVDFRLTPLEAVQVIRALDGMQIFTVVGPEGNEVLEINHLIKALRGELRGRSLEALAQKFCERPMGFLSTIRRVPNKSEMWRLMKRYSRDNGLAFFVSARRVVMPYLKREGLVSVDELDWFKEQVMAIER